MPYSLRTPCAVLTEYPRASVGCLHGNGRWLGLGLRRARQVLGTQRTAGPRHSARQVGPLMLLTRGESELAQFEAALALTNLASMDDGTPRVPREYPASTPAVRASAAFTAAQPMRIRTAVRPNGDAAAAAGMKEHLIKHGVWRQLEFLCASSNDKVQAAKTTRKPAPTGTAPLTKARRRRRRVGSATS